VTESLLIRALFVQGSSLCPYGARAAMGTNLSLMRLLGELRGFSFYTLIPSPLTPLTPLSLRGERGWR